MKQGDEKLAKICEEIYAKHKKALDLIFEYKTNTMIYSDGGQSLPNEDWLRP